MPDGMEELNRDKLLREFDFPIDDYLRGNVLAARTITRTGMWWSAMLLIEDPNSEGRRYIAMYRWKKSGKEWKRIKKFTCWSREDAVIMREFLQQHELVLE